MKNAWNQEINLKKKGKRDLPASKDKNLAKISKENDKNWMVEPRANAEREKRRELFEKYLWKSLNLSFLKSWFTSFDRSKIILDWSKQTETPSLQILKISIGRKTEWIDRIRQRLTIFLRKNTIFEKQNDLTQSFEIYEQKCMSMRWYDFQIKNIKPKIPKNKISCNLHKFSSNKLSLHIIQSICNNLVGQTINTHNNMYNV